MARLSDYYAKRDFGRTPEPRGRVGKGKGKSHRFVIQRHDATRLHYDFRLEVDGVYKSWAVTKVPSLDPATKRLAVEVEDHPLDYGTFEGTIPQGEYGGGTVQLWDRGTWKSQSETPPLRDLAKGQLKIELSGKRLKGGWALVRMRDDPKKPGRKVRHNWLLIKEKDDEARPGEPDTLLDEDTSVKSGRTLEEIATKARSVWHSNKAKTITQRTAALRKAKPVAKKESHAHAAKEKIPGFVEPELCKIVPKPPGSEDWVHEVKFDGYRMQARVEAGRARLFTRKRLDWSDRFPEIAKDCGAFPDGIYDGEIVALDKDGVADFAGLQKALSDGKTGGLVYFIFDVMNFEGRDLTDEPLDRRKEVLRKIMDARMKNNPRLRYVSHFSATGGAILDAACRMKLEGVISKRLSSPYRGGRNGDWTKAKCRGGQEVVIGGWWGDAKNLRSLLVGAYRDGNLVYLGRVGTGFNRENSGEVLKRLLPLRRATPPFARSADVPRTRGINWVEPTLVAETEFSTITSAGLLRQASFKGLREDKSPKSVVPEAQPAAKRAAAKKAPAKNEGASAMPKPAKAKASKGLSIAGIAISHPDKELWPADKTHDAVTKADLAAYYELAAPRLLPYIVDRPISLVRAPDGIDGQRFFQRHTMEGMQGTSSIKVKGEPKPYLMIEDLKGLIGLAQAGGLEIHPWGCKKGDPETPEILIFDLDPSTDLGFDAVIDAAKDMREKLAACGFKPFVKTTGGKGLHVVVAIKGTPKKPVAWKDAKSFARDICLSLERDHPDRYTTNMAKVKRKGKIFLDYLRNDRTSTAVAPWSPRARPHATIALPLSWPQVKRGLDPQDYTIANAKALLKRADPWKDFAKSAVSLEAARKKLDSK